MLLVLAPHPDDAEIHAGGLIARHVRQGTPVVVIDATHGEMGSRGTREDRDHEAAAAAKVLGLHARENLNCRDGYLAADPTALRDAIVDAIRRHRATTVCCLSPHARHPDHVALGEVATVAAKAAALHGLKTPSQAAAVPGVRLWFCEAELRGPVDALIPLTEADWATKMAAIRCYHSQLSRSDDRGLPETSIAKPEFLSWIEERGRAWGREAGAPYAEAIHRGPDFLRVMDLTQG
jgi:N-acetylglucosamine malate deacetylase 1